MAKDSQVSNGAGWLEASGLQHILRSLGLAVHPAKLATGLVGVVLTVVWGGLLDAVWKIGGGMEGKSLWTYLTTHLNPFPLRYLPEAGFGAWAMLQSHTIYFVLFVLGVMVIWSLCGGAICRLAAMQFARDDKLTMRQGWKYACQKLFGGFFLAPCIPAVLIAVTAVCMILGGALLRVPLLGDLVGGVFFLLAIIGGFVISVLLLGLAVGGNLFWPAVAVEGSDAFDAFSRGLSYPLSKPWKTILYALIAVVFASICWAFAHAFTFFMLSVTREIVAFGTSPFGWWSRGQEGEALSKMKLLWPMHGPEALYVWPTSSQLKPWEYVSAFFVAAYVLIVVGLLWSFMASLYFSASTVIYFLLRRDVDGTDLEDVYTEEEGEKSEADRASPSPTSAADKPAESTGGEPQPLSEAPRDVSGAETAAAPGPDPGGQ